jgi:hypothetical protein
VGTVEPIDGIVSGGTAMALRRSLAGLLGVPALLLPALLAGCGDDSSVADPPVQSAPPSIATSDPPAHESAEHFIRRWAGVEKQMENTGKTAAYLSFSKACKACTKLATQVEGFYAGGGYVKWGGWRITSIRVNAHNGGTTTYAVRNRSLPTVYKESSSGALKHLSGGVTTELLTLKRTASGWLVTAKAELAS